MNIVSDNQVMWIVGANFQIMFQMKNYGKLCSYHVDQIYISFTAKNKLSMMLGSCFFENVRNSIKS